MELIDHLVETFREDLTEVFKKESLEKDFLPQEEFESCLRRAEAGIDIATTRAKRILGMSIAKHRSKGHGDDTSEEITELSSLMTEEDQEKANAKSSYWFN